MYISFFSVGCMYAKLPKILIFCFLLGVDCIFSLNISSLFYMFLLIKTI